MNIRSTHEAPAAIEADTLVVGHYQDSSPSGAAAAVNEASGGVLDRLIEAKELSGKLAKLTTLLAPQGVAARAVVVTGWGPKADFDRAAAFRSIAAATKLRAANPQQTVAVCAGDDWSADQVEAAVCGALVGCQGQDLYRAEKNLHPVEQILWAGGPAEALQAGQQLAAGVNLTRRLVNEPPSTLPPAEFAVRAEREAAACGLEIEVWDRARLETERCGALLAVARGSAAEPRLVIVRHAGGPPGQAGLALVGKGVTFDSGGLSLKPSDSMKTMKCDMAGAATVLGAMTVIARLQLPVNVIGLMGLVENMVSGDAYKLGDVLTARSGKTIEVLNTDAEGRLVLADVLDVAVERGAARVIDLATLTGACMVALGTDVAGLMTNDQAWCDEVAAAARLCGEAAWQLPMFEDYGEQIKSKVADIKNVGEGRWGGAITAAKFLEEFVGQTPWVHIDIAGPSFLDSDKPWIDAGGSGAFVRTLVEVARRGVRSQ